MKVLKKKGKWKNLFVDDVVEEDDDDDEGFGWKKMLKKKRGGVRFIDDVVDVVDADEDEDEDEGEEDELLDEEECDVLRRDMDMCLYVWMEN